MSSNALRIFARASRFALLFVILSPTSGFSEWTFDKVSGSSLSFKNEKDGKKETLKTAFSDPKFVSILSDPESGTPYVLYEGLTCEKCEPSNTSLYLERLDGKGKATKFSYPGKITDTKKGVLVYQGRLFYGHCLPSVKAGVVIHQREVVDRRGTQKSVVIAEPGPQYVYEVLLERRLPNEKTTLDLVKRRVCTEISGRNRNVLRKPLDLTPRKGLDDDEEEDEETKEKAEAKSEGSTGGPATD
jgi:hypothetical protein